MYLGDSKLSLEQHKKMTEDFTKGYHDILESKIIVVNNIKFFVFQDQTGDEINLSFTSDFKDQKALLCIIKYKKPDEGNATKLFDKLLKDFRYK